MTKDIILARLNAQGSIIWSKLQIIHPKLKSVGCPSIILNNRFTATAGMAYQYDRRIEMATKFIIHSVEYYNMMFNVILPHELAHIADYDLFGESNKKCGHGDNWKMIMFQLGLNPDKYHPMRLK